MKAKRFNSWIKENLNQIKQSNLHRELVEISSSMTPEIVIDKKIYYQFASNNYLGLTTDVKITKSVISALQTISDTSADAKDQREALQSLQDVNGELSARIATLDKSLAAAKRSAAQAKARANANAKAAQDKSEDVIKFP